MPIRLKPADVVVIGLGAAGGVAVLPLARAGLKVVGLEAGTWMEPARDYHADEIHNNVRRAVTTSDKLQREAPTIRANPSERARRTAGAPMMNAVGGTSIHYWAQSWRLHPWDFQTRSETIRRYGESALPKGTTLEDWPIRYEDVEPYYDIIEHEVGVSGKAGNIQGRIDPAGNIFEGPRGREYPMPPLRGTGFTDRMEQVARTLGWNPFHPPAAINTQSRNGRAGCAYHGYCATGGCHVRAKNSTDITTIPAAMKTKNLTVVDRAHVTRIESSGERATGVTYLRGGKEYFQPAKAVLLASYTYENSRLLLLSKSKGFANGLANNHGQVGRHYFPHWSGGSAGVDVYALFPFDLNLWYGLPAQGITVDNWGDDHFDHSGLGFIGGATLHVMTERHPIDSAAISTMGRTPLWGSAWKKYVHENAGRMAACYIQVSSFPYETSYLDLDPEVKDPLGDPVCRVTSGNPKENEIRCAKFAQGKMEQWYREAGAIEVMRTEPAGAGLSTHAYGGTRMGDNVQTNVVDRWGFAHEVPNLGMLGASVFGSSGARNPTLTVQALAWRSAERLVKNWKSITK